MSTSAPTSAAANDGTKDPAKYRPCVGIMMVGGEDPDAGQNGARVFVGKRIDAAKKDAPVKGNWWQMPQGGVDDGEDLEKAMFRELEEETGVTQSHATIIGQLEEELFYDLPAELQSKLWKGRYLGQRQTWFLVRFTGTASDIDLEAHKYPEFSAWKWADIDQLPELIVPFKKDIYQAVVDGFRDKI